MTIEDHQVRDGSRLITFNGWLLGHVSSQRPEVPRWTELSLFKTKGGSYVLEKVGKSVVLHEPGCPRIIGNIPRFQEAHPGDDPDVGYTYDDCVGDTYDITTLLAEEDRYWATIAEDPNQIVTALYRSRDGARHLPRVSVELLKKVAEKDSEIGSAYLVERIS